MATVTCSHCGGMGSFNKGRMGAHGWETYYERCGACNGQGNRWVPDPQPKHSAPPRRQRRNKAKGKSAADQPIQQDTASAAPARPKKEMTFESLLALVVAIGLTWLAYEGGAQLPWWGWLLLFFVPLIGINSALERMPVFTRRLRKLLFWATLITIAGLILTSVQSGP